MRGNITRRGKASWRLKFDVGTDDDGKRKIQFETVHGTKSDAQKALAKRLTEFAEGRHVARTIETVATYAKHWIENIAPASRAPISVDRHDSIIRTQITPGLGHIELQKLDGTAIDKFYASRRDKADMTRRQIHAVLRRSSTLPSRQRRLPGIQSPISRRRPRQSAGTRSWSWMSRSLVPCLAI